ncbi:MAG: GAF domain-containing protein, partial [Anaerolineae bacterium]|nr:GAF domain-containing protein [Anaerolineae bacterium]
MSSTTEIENRPIASQTENNLSIEVATLRAMELETVAQVSAAVSTILNLDQLLQEVVDLVKDRFGLYHVHIYLLDPSKEQLTLAAGAGEPGRLMLAQGHRIALNRKQSLVASAARLREGVVVNDVTLEPNFLPNVYLPNTRSEMAIPLILADEVIGVLDVQSESVGRFSADDVRVKTILGQQIAVAVRNARVFELTQHQLRLQEANLTIAEFFRDTELTVEEGLERALNVILDVFRADNVTMLAYDNQNQNWNEDAWAGVEIPQIVSVSGAGAYPHATQAFETGQVVVVEDTRRHPDFPPELLVKEPGVKSSLALPLVVGGTIRKVFVVNYLSRLHLF